MMLYEIQFIELIIALYYVSVILDRSRSVRQQITFNGNNILLQSNLESIPFPFKQNAT